MFVFHFNFCLSLDNSHQLSRWAGGWCKQTLCSCIFFLYSIWWIVLVNSWLLMRCASLQETYPLISGSLACGSLPCDKQVHLPLSCPMGTLLPYLGAFLPFLPLSLSSLCVTGRSCKLHMLADRKEIFKNQIITFCRSVDLVTLVWKY